MQLTLDRFGRMVLPKAIRDGFGLRPGDVLDAEEQKDAIVLRPLARADCIKREGRALVFTGNVAGDVGTVLDDAREMRLDRVAGKRGSS